MCVPNLFQFSFDKCAYTKIIKLNSDRCLSTQLTKECDQMEQISFTFFFSAKFISKSSILIYIMNLLVPFYSVHFRFAYSCSIFKMKKIKIKMLFVTTVPCIVFLFFVVQIYLIFVENQMICTPITEETKLHLRFIERKVTILIILSL